ncbi:hypothetical protein EST38_g8177 [Candolleomyces aberdarensis]|uniref:Uncharacterized protein n=1 Tax=Candolleomyces aberdarensis TaxID=2316362 RepID=A0A4Q2DDA6_9AGAR|nr:hypothetical protein EST38_g8177 [Candolleomyces aberdarensis]
MSQRTPFTSLVLNPDLPVNRLFSTRKPSANATSPHHSKQAPWPQKSLVPLPVTAVTENHLSVHSSELEQADDDALNEELGEAFSELFGEDTGSDEEKHVSVESEDASDAEDEDRESPLFGGDDSDSEALDASLSSEKPKNVSDEGDDDVDSLFGGDDSDSEALDASSSSRTSTDALPLASGTLNTGSKSSNQPANNAVIRASAVALSQGKRRCTDDGEDDGERPQQRRRTSTGANVYAISYGPHAQESTPIPKPIIPMPSVAAVATASDIHGLSLPAPSKPTTPSHGLSFLGRSTSVQTARKVSTPGPATADSYGISLSGRSTTTADATSCSRVQDLALTPASVATVNQASIGPQVRPVSNVSSGSTRSATQSAAPATGTGNPAVIFNLVNSVRNGSQGSLPMSFTPAGIDNAGASNVGYDTAYNAPAAYPFVPTNPPANSTLNLAANARSNAYDALGILPGSWMASGNVHSWNGTDNSAYTAQAAYAAPPMRPMADGGFNAGYNAGYNSQAYAPPPMYYGYYGQPPTGWGGPNPTLPPAAPQATTLPNSSSINRGSTGPGSNPPASAPAKKQGRSRKSRKNTTEFAQSSVPEVASGSSSSATAVTTHTRTAPYGGYPLLPMHHGAPSAIGSGFPSTYPLCLSAPTTHQSGVVPATALVSGGSDSTGTLEASTAQTTKRQRKAKGEGRKSRGKKKNQEESTNENVQASMSGSGLGSVASVNRPATSSSAPVQGPSVAPAVGVAPPPAVVATGPTTSLATIDPDLVSRFPAQLVFNQHLCPYCSIWLPKWGAITDHLKYEKCHGVVPKNWQDNDAARKLSMDVHVAFLQSRGIHVPGA